MDVSNRQKKLQVVEVEGISASGTETGQSLLDAVATLSGLPEPMVQVELQSIVERAGHSTESLTLDELRAAMIAYLESMHDEVLSAEEAQLQ